MHASLSKQLHVQVANKCHVPTVVVVCHTRHPRRSTSFCRSSRVGTSSDRSSCLNSRQHNRLSSSLVLDQVPVPGGPLGGGLGASPLVSLPARIETGHCDSAAFLFSFIKTETRRWRPGGRPKTKAVLLESPRAPRHDLEPAGVSVLDGRTDANLDDEVLLPMDIRPGQHSVRWARRIQLCCLLILLGIAAQCRVCHYDGEDSKHPLTHESCRGLEKAASFNTSPDLPHFHI
jgi:hypothetical protein